ncbi:hypothetical protein RQP46_011177 [Phenoliferia psychrophenolica]
MVGASHGGTPADLRAVALGLNNGFGSGILMSAFVGLTHGYPDFKEALEAAATPKMLALMADNLKHCLVDVPATFVDYFATDEYFYEGAAGELYWQMTPKHTVSDLNFAVLEETRLGFNKTLTPTMPLHVIHAISDQLIPYGQAATMVAEYCASGANLEFITNPLPFIQHFGLDELSIPTAIKFLADRLDGVPFHKGCVFTSMEERTDPQMLQIEGTMPSWLTGTLYRIGPAKFSIPLTKPVAGKASFEVTHWFDGLAQVHRFEFVNGGVIHRSKDTARELEDYVKEHGNFRDTNNFAQPDPCRTIFGKFMNFFTGSLDLTKKSRQNVNITISPGFPLPGGGAPALVAKTDSVLLQLLNPETLEPLEQFDYSRFHPSLDGQMAASHAIHYDGALYNYNLNVKRRIPQYHVFELRESGVRILATVTDLPPTYMHSIQATERYIILTLWDGEVWGPSIGWHGNFYASMLPPTGRSTLFCVFDRLNGGEVARFEGPNCFAFHTINSFDDPQDGSVVIDLAVVKDWRTMDSMYLDKMRTGAFTGSVATRFRLPAIPTTYVPVDRPYRFTYGTNHQDSVAVIFSRIIKLNMADHTEPPSYWSLPGDGCVGEPVFVPNPSGTTEDDGVLLTVVTEECEIQSSL